MQVVNFCKSYGNQADGFYATNAWTDISEKLKIKSTLTWCQCINSLYNVFPGQKMSRLGKTKQNKNRRFDYKPKLCRNEALPLDGMHLNIPSTECWTLCRAASSSGTACVDNAYARSLAPWAILSISGDDDTTSPHKTFEGVSNDCSTHSSLW